MNRINNKGFTIIEIILSFSFIMIISVGLFLSATNYKNKQQLESLRRDLETYKTDIITNIQKEVNKRGLKDISKDGNVINLLFHDNKTLKIQIVEDAYNLRNTGICFYIDNNNKTFYYLSDVEKAKIESINLNADSIYIGTSSKVNVYKITINIDSGNKDMGVFSINIVLNSFSNE